ncbi:MAG: DNA-directed RNA polymerase subunit alpha C-terminal domain-containing protein [Phycisphaerae bacterium]|jgi:DNA-directed RNA polymerase subunit alpha
MTDVTADVSTFFEQQEVGVDSYDHLADTVLETFKARERFAEMLSEYKEQVERGQGEALKLALGLAVLGRYRDALEWLGKTPDGKFRRFYAARAAVALGRHEQALQELEQAAAKGWDRFDADMHAAAIYLQQGDVAAASKLAKAHERVGQDRADWYYVQGLILERADDWAGALEQYEKALALNADHPQATFRCAYVYDIHGEDERAIDLYEELAFRPRAHVNALMNLAVIYEDLGRYDKARECLQRVLKAYPNHARARLFLKDVESCWQMVVEEAGDEHVDAANQLLDTAISEFELSVRARNCLKKMNIRSLGDLVRLSESELLSFKNFGETSLTEIKTLLNKRGLHLGQSAEELVSQPTGEPGVARVIVPPGREAILQKPVSELELSVRSRRCLQRLAVSTLGELCQLSEADLLAARNFGVTSLNEVKARLADHSLQLAPKRGE